MKHLIASSAIGTALVVGALVALSTGETVTVKEYADMLLCPEWDDDEEVIELENSIESQVWIFQSWINAYERVSAVPPELQTLHDAQLRHLRDADALARRSEDTAWFGSREFFETLGPVEAAQQALDPMVRQAIADVCEPRRTESLRAGGPAWWHQEGYE